jgi:uncharacterized membrane protein YebE (DUF533 family)
MNILKTAALGVVAWVAYRAWQKKKGVASSPSTLGLDDTGGTTAPHGDPLLADLEPERAAPRLAQSSRGFGEA